MKQPWARRLTSVSMAQVQIHGGLWARRQAVNRAATIPHVYRMCRETGRLDAFRLDPVILGDRKPVEWWDSDVYKWIEGACYSLITHPDPPLRAQVDEAVQRVAQAQQADGYLNTHHTLLCPEKRWTNLRYMHELYNAGHLFEAAVAHQAATGTRALLDPACRLAEYIGSVFGPEKHRGYDGHPEIEPALVRLYRATGERRHLELAKLFIDARGTTPNFFDQELPRLGRENTAAMNLYVQAHVPVRELSEAVGHAVCAMYLCSAMTDVAVEFGDESLMRACERIWANMTTRRMYITGGIGSTPESFTYDYDLPNHLAYAETCASIAMTLWCHRMLQASGDAKYADVMERALYNTVLAGAGLDGKSFFYENRLASHGDFRDNRNINEEGKPQTGAHLRKEWYWCACCPPNLMRFVASLGEYIYMTAADGIYVNLYVASRAVCTVSGRPVTLIQQSDYPWDGLVALQLEMDGPFEMNLNLRLPDWCVDPQIQVNGQPVAIAPIASKGYACVRRVWRSGDRVRLVLPMPAVRIEAQPLVWENAGRVALQRGPLVYCIEAADNGPQLDSLCLPRNAPLEARFAPDLLDGVVALHGTARSSNPDGWDGRLYRPARGATRDVPFLAVPYAFWANRQPGEMLVWIRADI